MVDIAHTFDFAFESPASGYVFEIVCRGNATMIKKEEENKKKERKFSDGRTVGVKSRGCVRSLCVSRRSADSLREWKRRIGCRREGERGVQTTTGSSSCFADRLLFGKLSSV